MKALIVACLLLSACSDSKQVSNKVDKVSVESNAVTPMAPVSPARIDAAASGAPYAVRFQNGALVFCDTGGGHKVDLITGRTAAADVACKKDEPNTACSSFPVDVSVRAPASDPNDIVDVGGSSYPLTGHVQDCALDGKVLAIATPSNIMLIDSGSGARAAIDSHGGDRVAINNLWVAWTDGPKIHAVLRASVKSGS